ncbi:hypothetical protein AAC387_Pa03g0449 [Persea americana]
MEVDWKEIGPGLEQGTEGKGVGRTLVGPDTGEKIEGVRVGWEEMGETEEIDFEAWVSVWSENDGWSEKRE